MKRKNLEIILGVGRVKTSSAEVGNIIQYANEHPEVFEGRRGSAIRRERLEAYQTLFATCFTEITIPLLNEGSWKAPVADIGKMVAYLANRDAHWKAILHSLKNQDSIETSFYHDEITGGNVVATDPSRKILVAYLQLNAEIAIAHDVDMWLPVTCIRSRTLKTVAGGTSGFLFHILRFIYSEPLSFLVGAGVLRVQLRLTRLLGDEAALKDTFNTKGQRFGCKKKTLYP